MIYYLPDSQDLVDPSFDFETEERSVSRMRHKDDLYAHQIFDRRAYDGLLVSKGIVEGYGSCSGRYTLSQRQRFLRNGVKEFCRTRETSWGPLPVLGDCGGFTYIREDKPPYTVDEVVSFYEDGQFDLGISVDHVILEFNPSWDDVYCPEVSVVRGRQEITLELAREFLLRSKTSRTHFTPLGVAQGWSPKSYAYAVDELQKMGYTYIALGGMVPLKTHEILACLHEIQRVRKPEVCFHLLGVTRLDEILTFDRLGVASFDSTSPLIRAFKDDKENYFTLDGAFPAIRIPQVDVNPKVKASVLSGALSQELAFKLERASLDAMSKYDKDEISIEQTLEPLLEYHHLLGSKPSLAKNYRRVLEARPWKNCQCEICKTLGYQVIIFRGAERNRRRGFHNVWTFYQRLHANLGTAPKVVPLFPEVFL